jgi:hypothetical protein
MYHVYTGTTKYIKEYTKYVKVYKYTLIFRPSYQGSFSGVGRGNQQPSGEDEEDLTLEYVTGKKQCSNQCTELEPQQLRYLDLRHVASHAEGSQVLRCRFLC